MTSRTIQPASARWNKRSVFMIVLAWLILHIGCLFTPGLLDDVDSIYIEIARSMLVRHDYVTPYIDGIRFFDKPPLMYWLAAGSMHLFGVHDWAARLPLALLTLALLLATYALGLRLFAGISPAAHPDRGALYSALALVTCIGPFLYTRFYIPDLVIALWMTLAIHAFLVALDRIQAGESALLPCLAFAAVTALNLLTKGLIGVVFPVGFVLLYLAWTHQLRLLRKLHLVWSTLLLLAIAAPWHILAALRNPPIALPPGLGLPAHGGWAWFYLYNEHIARFLQRRIPHDYGQVPVLLFWLLAAVWLFPWMAFLPPAILRHVRDLRGTRGPRSFRGLRGVLGLRGLRNSRAEASTRARIKAPSIAPLQHDADESATPLTAASLPVPTLPGPTPRDREAALTLLLWSGIVLGFFTLSARQEYYSLPAIPALALMAGGLLARADRAGHAARSADSEQAARSTLAWHRWLLVPLCSLVAVIAFFFAITAPHVPPHTDIYSLLSHGGDHDLSLSHLLNLTGNAMALFRAPLVFVGLGMIVIGPLAYRLRRPRRNRPGHPYAANLTTAAAALCLLLCMHTGLVRFYPVIGSKGLAEAIVHEQHRHPRPDDLILIDGELTAGSTLLFYTRQPVHLVNGRINGLWYGSFWPDSPAVFETNASLDRLWAGPRRLFLLTYHPIARTADLSRFAPVHVLAAAGGKSILTNR